MLSHGVSKVMTRAVPKFTVILLEEVERINQALAVADVVCTTTNATSPLFDATHLKVGAHVNAVGAFTPEMQEIPHDVVKRSIVVLDTEHAWDAGDLKKPLDLGEISKENAVGNLGLFFCREMESLVSAKREKLGAAWTFFKSVGVAVQDVATGKAAYEAALAAGLGTSVAL